MGRPINLIKKGLTDKYIVLVCITAPLTNRISIKNVTMRLEGYGGGGRYQGSNNLE